MKKQSDKIDVQKRIERSRLPERQRQELLADIEHLDNKGAWKLYPESVREKDFNAETCLSKKRCFDVDWTAHGAYRSELRDRDPEMVNEDVSKFIFNRHFDPKNNKRKPPKKDELRIKGRGGPVVIDYDATGSPVDVNIVTTYPKGASEMDNKKIASELVKLAKVLSGALASKELLTANGKLGVAINEYHNALRNKNNGLDDETRKKVLNKVGDAMDTLQDADEILEKAEYM